MYICTYMDKIAYSYLCCGVIFSIEQQLSYPTFQIGHVFLFYWYYYNFRILYVKLVLISIRSPHIVSNSILSRFEVQ